TLFHFLSVETPLAKDAVTKYRSCLRWFKQSLGGREPTTTDLTFERAVDLWRFCGERGLARATIERHRIALGQLWKFAALHGLVTTAENLPPVVGRYVERPTPRAVCAKGTLQCYYSETFRHERVEKLGYPVRTEYDAAIRQFGFWAGGNIGLEQLTPAKIEAYRKWLIESATKTEPVAYRYALHVTAVARHAEPSRFRPPHAWNKQPVVEAPEGSILWFVQAVYATEKALAAGTQGCIRRRRRCAASVARSCVRRGVSIVPR
ncbi:MAG TPA: site-specific integrase, partial [Pirellulales bacterium]|nr:site-specific integrase [Pirellulales bacterium]